MRYQIAHSLYMVAFMQPTALDELATFVRVVRVGSLAGAARELGVPKSTVSRRLTRLESSVDLKLVHRGSRTLALTADGRRLFDSVHSSIQQIELAISAVRESGELPRGNIRITAPEDFGRLLLLDELHAFARVWPEITFDIDFTGRFVDLVEEGYDLAIRASAGSNVPGAGHLITRKLAASRLQVAAAASADPIESIDELAGKPFVLFRQPSRHQTFTLVSEAGKKTAITVEGSFVVHDYSSMAQLVARGAGLGLMPRMHIDHPKSELRCVLPQWCVTVADSIALVYPSRQLPRRVSLLIDHLTERLGPR